jgi:16S rRNA (adenine1518-N6/adenine1519-N6)-dimethyltransferase
MSAPAALLRSLEQRARKRFGQHFLTEPAIAGRMVAAAGIAPGDAALEIGPGLGILTEALVRAGARVTAIELDRDLAAFLRERMPDVELVEGDAMKAPLGPLGSVAVVANLPYNVGTGLLLRLLTEAAPPRVLVVMLQKEVAERIVAPPGSRARGSLSVAVQARADARIAFRVPAGAFHPPPRVESAVLVIRPRPGEALGVDFDRVVRAAFSAPRKKLRNALRTGLGQDADAVLLRSGVDGDARPAALDLAAFHALARAAKP